MNHNIYEMLSYVSHIITMTPGDVYALGSPSGSGLLHERFLIYVEDGDVATCAIESIGTLTNPVSDP